MSAWCTGRPAARWTAFVTHGRRVRAVGRASGSGSIRRRRRLAVRVLNALDPKLGRPLFAWASTASALVLILLTTFLHAARGPGQLDQHARQGAELLRLMLVLTTGMLGVFMSLDLFLFYMMWEVMLMPMYFIIGIWGGERRIYASIKFFIYTMFGSLLMLVGDPLPRRSTSGVRQRPVRASAID